MNLELHDPLEVYVTTCKLTDKVQSFLLSNSWLQSQTDFFKALAEFIQQELDVDYFRIDRFISSNFMAQSLVVYTSNKFQKNITSGIKNTPAEKVLEQDFLCIPVKVREYYPNDETLKQTNAESFAGIALRGSDGTLTGLITIINRKPVADTIFIERILKLIALKASAELEYRHFQQRLHHGSRTIQNNSDTHQLNALRESELKFRRYINFAPHGVFVVNETGQYLEVNPAACHITGYNKEEILKMNLMDLVPAEAHETARAHFGRVVDEGFANGEMEFITKNGEIRYWSIDAVKLSTNRFLGYVIDTTERKEIEHALQTSEEKIRKKLQSILSPEGNLSDMELIDIIDVPGIQKLMESFYKLAGVSMAIINTDGKILVGAGWQDICTKFHRVHPKACHNCFESDIHLTKGISDGEFMLYKCKNNMWYMATPLNIGGEHKGNLYIGQFFFDDEPVSYEVFRNQATKYGFELQHYMEALDRVPRLNRKVLKYAKVFFLNLAQSISQLSYSNIKLARSIEKHKKVEQALWEHEEFLKTAQEIAHLGSWSLNLNTGQLRWSDEVYRIFGLQPQEFSATYEGFLDAVHPEDRQTVNKIYTDSVNQHKDSYETEHRILRKHSGELRYVYEKCRHIKDETGKITGSMGMILDITDYKLAEKALRESELLLRESQSAGNIASYSVNLKNKTWKASDELYKIFGIDKNYPHTLQSWENNLHPDFREKLLHDLYSADHDLLKFEHEYKVFRVSDRKEIWVQGLAKFEFDDQQNRIRLVGTIQDITKRKEAELALRQLNEELEERVADRTAELQRINEELIREIKIRQEKEKELMLAEEKYRTIADHNYDWETWLNPQGQFIYVSPSCFRITGYSVSEFTNDATLFYRIAHPDDRERVKKYFHQALEGKITDNSFDFRIINRDGEEKWIAHSCHSVFNDQGKWLGQRGSNSDITPRKNLERFLIDSQNKLRALTQNMIIISEKERINIAREIHDELGHMLTAIKYDLENLMDEKKLTVDLVKTELPAICGMVDSLIESVRKIATELRPGILDHLGLFPALEWQIEKFILLTKINCRLEKSENLNVTFNQNETTTIFRILQEILTNITRHAKAKRVVISFSYQVNEFMLKVTDDGVGFHAAEKLQGNSLGLLGMQERALSIGGKIDIESRPGNGTTIMFLLYR